MATTAAANKSNAVTKQIGSNNQKVKIYFLTQQDTWVDLGVGNLFHVLEFNPTTEEEEEFIQVQSVQQEEINDLSEISPEELALLSRDIEHKVIFRFHFHCQNSYEKQNDSIIICRVNQQTLEFAISFTDPDSTNDFWEFVKKHNGLNMNEGNQSTDAEQYNDLQMPHYSRLEDTLQAIDNDLTHFSQGIVWKPEFLDKLFQAFEELEDINEVDKLHLIFQIVKKLILSREQKLIILLISDKYFYACLGAFEYKDGKEDTKREHYRDDQRNKSIFKQIIEIKSNDILNRIHTNYRLNYLRDVVIAPFMDDSTNSVFNQVTYYSIRESSNIRLILFVKQIITHNNIEIIEFVKEKSFLTELAFKFFNNLDDSILFFTELLSMLSNSNIAICLKLQLVETMNLCGFNKVFLKALQMISDPEVEKENKAQKTFKLLEGITMLANENKKDLINILFSATDQSALDESRSYLNLLSYLLMKEDTGLQVQVVEIFKILFEYMKGTAEIEDRVVELLLSAFFAPCFENYIRMDISNQFASFVTQFTDLFQLAYKLCPSKFRPIVIKQELIVQLTLGVDTKDKAIHLAFVKLVRQLITCDSLLIPHLINAKIIDKIWLVYKKHERRPNLVNSTFQDMMQFLLVKNFYQIPKLFKYIIQQFGDEIRARQAKNLCFKKIIDTYGEQKQWIHQERSSESSGEIDKSDSLTQPYGQNFELIEEEKYFDSADDKTSEILEEESAAAAAASASDKENISGHLQREQFKHVSFKKKQNNEVGEEIQNNTAYVQPNNKTSPAKDAFVDSASIASSSSLIRNIGAFNINEQASAQSASELTQSQRITLDFGEDITLTACEEAGLEATTSEPIQGRREQIKKKSVSKDQEELKDDLNTSMDSIASTKSINSKRQFKELNYDSASYGIPNQEQLSNGNTDTHQEKEVACSNEEESITKKIKVDQQ